MRISTFRNALDVFKAEGWLGISSRAKRRLSKCYSSAHLLVYISDSDAIENAALQSKKLFEISSRFTKSLVCKEIFAHDDAEIDELTEVDPWKFPKELTIKQLNEGCKCFVAKKENRIIACVCAWVDSHYYDDFLKFDYAFAADEAYYWRGFCTPAFRGIGILPRIFMYAVMTVKNQYNKPKQISWVRATNKPMQKTLHSLGWKVVGRGGFIEICGLRLHYLWGREAFRQTKKRVSVQFANKSRQ